MRVFRSLRARLGAIFLGFLLLVGSSATATFLAARAQANDASVINLAGRQRMLTHKMTWLALTQPDHSDLTASIQLFDQTLHALRDGGLTLDPIGRAVLLPPAPEPAVRAQLDEVTKMWAAFRAHLRPVDAVALQVESPIILAQLDNIVSWFEARAQAKLLRLQLIQLVSFLAALALLVWGYVLTQRWILQPLMALGQIARQIGVGQLADPVPVIGNNEFGELGQAFEAMRVEIAVAREQLETHVTQRTHELASAFEFSQEIVAQLDLEHLLRSVTDRAQALAHAEAASLCLLNEEKTALTLVATNGGGASHPTLRQTVGHSLALRVVGAGETVVAEAACVSCGFLRAHAPGWCIAAPLRAGEATLGALCVVGGVDRPADPDETRALTLLANSAAIAIANARLAEAGRRQAEQAALLAERERLAAELHDHLAQTLSFLSLKVDRVRAMLVAGQTAEVEDDLRRMTSAIGGAYGQVRAALTGLREPLPVEDDLAPRLAVCVADFREASGLPAELIMADPPALALLPVTQAQVLHIVREALTNVRRHAQARRVWVRVEQKDGEALFTVEDDGRGFDPQSIAGDHHLGLTIMRARAEHSGGSLSICSALGSGTRVVASFPLIRDD